MDRDKGRKKSGFTIIEVVVSVLILLIILTGSSMLYVRGRERIHTRKYQRAAVQLASRKIEELKGSPYVSVTAGQSSENITLENFTYSLTADVEDLGLYKKVTVTAQWQGKAGSKNLVMSTFLSP